MISVATLNQMCSLLWCSISNVPSSRGLISGLVAEDWTGVCHPTACIPTKRLGNIIGKLPCLKVEVATGPLSYQIKDGQQLGFQSLGTNYERLNPSSS